MAKVAYIPSEKVKNQIEKSFSYHSPAGDQWNRYEEIRMCAKNFALMLESQCPESRELSLALTHLEESVFFANAAIARNEPVSEIVAEGKK